MASFDKTIKNVIKAKSITEVTDLQSTCIKIYHLKRKPKLFLREGYYLFVLQNASVVKLAILIEFFYFLFLCLFFLKRFLRLWVAILCLFLFLPLGIIVNFLNVFK